MRKQGAIILGIGGDNSHNGVGTFYEGVMTKGYSSNATDDAVHANSKSTFLFWCLHFMAPFEPDNVTASHQLSQPNMQGFEPGKNRHHISGGQICKTGDSYPSIGQMCVRKGRAKSK